MPIDDVGEHVAIGYDLYLIPFAGLDESLHLIPSPEKGKQSRFLTRLSGHYLPTPGDDSARGTLLIKLARIFVVEVKIRLVAG